MKKSTLFASTSLIGLLAAPSAFAADLAPMPVKYREAEKLPWGGFYLGGNAGYAWSSDPRTDCSFTGPGTSPCVPAPAILNGGVISGTAAFPAVKATGAEYGLQAGYNWQVKNFVVGVEADINSLTAGGSSQFAGIDPGKGPDSLSSRYNWLGTARGRVGVTAGPALFYATGGFAYGRVGHDYAYAIGYSNSQMFSLSEDRMGWTAGGGVEYAIDPHWSVKAEYLYVHLAASSLNLSTLSFAGNGQTPSGTTLLNFNNNLNIARLGLNYRF
jgi:outer membrane immunogenic protein